MGMRPACDGLGMRPAGDGMGMRPAGNGMGMRPAGDSLGNESSRALYTHKYHQNIVQSYTTSLLLSVLLRVHTMPMATNERYFFPV